MTAAELGFIHRYVPGESPVTLLLLHGTGGDESDLLPLGQSVAPGWPLLSPRGKVSEHGMPRFFRRLAPGVFDTQDLIHRTHELAGFVAQAAHTYGLDPGRVVALGFSNGANIAGALLLLRPETLAGAVLLRPMVPLEPPQLPDLTGRPVLILAGRQDPIVPPAESERLAELLGRAGAAVELHWLDGGHGLGAEDLELTRQWLARHRNSFKVPGMKEERN